MIAWFPAFSMYNICMCRTLKCTEIRYKIYTDLHGQFLKVLIDDLCLLLLFYINYISVHSLHDHIRCPSAALHDVLIGNADGMHDGSCVMPQVVEAELRSSEALYGPLEAV